MKNRIITLKDNLPLGDNIPLMSMIGPSQEELARRHNIPLFKGIMYQANDDGYGNPVLKKVGENTVVLGGAILALEHLANATASFKPMTLNSIYSLNQGIAGNNMTSYISCFGLGTGGAALDFGNVFSTDIKAREIPGFVPLRSGSVLAGSDSNKYFFKKSIGGGNYNWYLKEFDSVPVIKSLWRDSAEENADGTEINAEVYNSTRTESIESFAEFVIKLNTYDIREYFLSIAELDMARYNSLGLFTGQKVDIGGGVYDYVNVRLFSYLNFENKSVKERTETEYRYRIYGIV